MSRMQNGFQPSSLKKLESPSQSQYRGVNANSTGGRRDAAFMPRVTGSTTMQPRTLGDFDSKVNPALDARMSGRQTIGTTEEQLVLGDVSAVGIVWIKNLDTTNFITVGTVTGQRGFKINPGEAFPFRAANNAIFCAANTAAVDVSYHVFSN